VGVNGAMAAHRHTVLIVEDNADTRDALALIVDQEGYEVVIASSGRKALATLSREETAGATARRRAAPRASRAG
jgi:CheY-like chemotaxis protein